MLKILLVDDHEVVRWDSILSKLALQTRSEAAAYAVKHRIENCVTFEK